MATTAEGLAAVADPMTPVPHRVVGVVAETPDAVTLTLEPVAGALAAIRPGQFVMVWAFGVGEIPISVSGVAGGGRVALTVRAVGAVSDAIVASLPGDLLGLRGPYGTAWPIEEATGRDALVVAGGLGLAPLRTAIEALAGAGPTRLTVVMGAREPDAGALRRRPPEVAVARRRRPRHRRHRRSGMGRIGGDRNRARRPSRRTPRRGVRVRAGTDDDVGGASGSPPGNRSASRCGCRSNATCTVGSRTVGAASSARSCCVVTVPWCAGIV